MRAKIKLSREQIPLILSILMLLGLFLLGYETKQIQDTQKELTEVLEKQRRTVKLLLKDYDLKALQAQLEEVTSRFKDQNPFPPDYPSPELDNLIVDLGNRTGVEIIGFKVKDTITVKLAEGDYNAHIRNISVQGSLSGLFSFVEGLENTGYPLVLDNLNLTLEEGSWHLKFDLIVYTLKA